MPDAANSLLLTDLIAVGYADGFLADPVSTAQRLLPAGFTLISPIYGTDFNGLPGQETVPYGIVATGPDAKTYVGIRGTDDAKEWLEDGFAFPESCALFPPNVRVHKGFADVYQTLAIDPKIDARHVSLAITGFNTPGVIVTGHSLGGALAYLLAAHLGLVVTLCETFESPRVGDTNFCNWMDSRVLQHFRHVIVGDLVPHAPPEIMRYTHAGVEIDHNPDLLRPLPADPIKHFAALHVLDSVRALLRSA